MEYSGILNYVYYMNKRKANYYKFDPDPDILEYTRKIAYILPDYIDDSYKFSILVHIVMKLMNDKYKVWQLYILCKCIVLLLIYIFYCIYIFECQVIIQQGGII